MSFRPGAVLGGRACPVSVILCYRLWIASSAEDGRWLTNSCGATPGWSVWCVVWGWRLPSGSGSYLTASTIPCLFYLGRAGMQQGDQAGHFKALGHACLGLFPWEDRLPSPRAHHLLLGWPRNHLRVKWKIPHLLPGPELSNVKWRDKNWPISHLSRATPLCVCAVASEWNAYSRNIRIRCPVSSQCSPKFHWWNKPPCTPGCVCIDVILDKH